jgi:hypothetical protein
MRGGVLTPREVRRLLKRPGVRVLHVYGVEPAEVEGGAAEELLTSLMAFLDGETGRFISFRVADFRDDDRHVLLVVEQSC